MKMRIEIARLCLLAAGCLAAAGVLAQVDAYPSKAVRVIVPFPPGQATDIVARVLAEQLAVSLKQPFVVENRAGAAGAIGMEAAARATADGSGPSVIAPHLIPNLPFDVQRDFIPITSLTSSAYVIAAHPSLGVTTLAALIERAKSKPGALNYASGGLGSTQHLTGEMLKAQAGIDIVHIAYKGSGPAVADAISGQVPILVDSVPATLPHVKAGRLVALAVTSRERSALMPELPTVAESGIAAFEATGWTALFAPAGTPEPIVRKLHQEAVAALSAEAVRDRLRALGAEPSLMSPERFAQFVRSENEKWGKVVKQANVRLQ
jgi:tripartite-type tricarboxylate transporter receptor subunit TctC